MSDAAIIATGLGCAFALWDLGRRKFSAASASELVRKELEAIRGELAVMQGRHDRTFETLDQRIKNLNQKIEAGRPRLAASFGVRKAT